MAYRIKNIISSKPGLAKVTNPELHYKVFTFLKHEEFCEPEIWIPLLDPESPSNRRTSYLGKFNLDGDLIDKILISDNSEFSAFLDMDINKTQGFVITDKEKQSAAGTVFLTVGDEIGYPYGYNELLNNVVEFDYKPTPEFWILGFDMFDKYLYAVEENFGDVRTGPINVYNFNFQLIEEGFPFPRENIPENYTPVNIKVIHELVHVVFRNIDNKLKGGIVNVYNLDGTFVKTLINDPELLNPWAIVKTPSEFGEFSCSYLIGSDTIVSEGEIIRGDGTISAYDKRGKFLGKLKDKKGNIIVINNLKTLKFYEEKLYYASGNIASRDVDEIQTAIFGYIEPYKKRCHKH